MIDRNHHMIALPKADEILAMMHGKRAIGSTLPYDTEIPYILSTHLGIPTHVSKSAITDPWGGSFVDMATHIWQAHREFLETASEEHLAAAIIERALNSTESVDSDEKWETRFSQVLERELGADPDLGRLAMQTAGGGPGAWTERVVARAVDLWREPEVEVSP